MTHPTPRSTTIGAIILWMSGALVSFVFVSLTVRTLTRHFDAFQIGVLRTSIGLVVLGGVAVVSPSRRRDLKASRPFSHVLRNLVHAAGGVAWTLAIAALPFATVFSLEFTAPAWVALLAFPVLSERVTPRALAGIAICTLGVLVIMRPGIQPVDGAMLDALAAAFCFGLSIVLTRRLALTQGVFAILFWMMVWQLLFYAVITLVRARGIAAGPAETWPAQNWLAETWPANTIPVAILLGLSGLAAQLCLSRALRIGEATTVVPLDFLRVPIIAVVGWWFYGEALSFWVFSGAALILAGIVFGLMPARRRPPPVPMPV